MNSTAIRDDWVGRTVDGKFTLLQWLGGGEECGVYLTELPGEGSQKAAIKLIPADGACAESRIASWEAARNLSHPHLLRLIETGRCTIDNAQFFYAVAEFAEENLSQVLPERPLTATETREMLEPIVDTLSYLHGKGFVHGHVKPENILVVGEQVKLSSDGLVGAGKPRNSLPALSVYDAPERASGAISEAADVWSLGVTLVEALTQHPPVWDRATESDAVVTESIPEPFESIARECLRWDPARRCSLGEIKERLNPAPAAALAAPATSAATPIAETPLETAKTEPGKPRDLVLAAAVLVVIAAVVTLEVRSYKSPAPGPAAEQRSGPAMDAAQHRTPASAGTGSQGMTVKGDVAERVQPDVLESARASIQGQVNVRIRVAVDASGNVANATFDAAGPSRYFARMAMQAAQRWRFKPAEVDGRAVASVWTLKFQFRRSGVEITPVETSP